MSKPTALFTKVLVSKTFGDEMKIVLDDAIKMAGFMKDHFTPEC
jgi:hypothetical protein